MNSFLHFILDFRNKNSGTFKIDIEKRRIYCKPATCNNI